MVKARVPTAHVRAGGRRREKRLAAAAAAETKVKKAKGPAPTGTRHKVSPAAVDQARAIVAGCRSFVSRAGSRGYVVDGRPCAGLTARLSATAMPNLPKRGLWTRAKGNFVRSRFGGSSAAVGIRIDAEVFHIVECVGGGSGDYVDEVVRAPARRQKRARGTPAPTHWSCPTCPLAGVRYHPLKPSPGWHRWTLAYLRDATAKGLTLVASQVPVAAWVSGGVATEIDDVAIDASGSSIVAIERKTGYEDVAGRPRKRRHPKVTVAGHEMWNTDHTLHSLQSAVASEMLSRTAGLVGGAEWARAVGRRSCVVYVSGKSYVPVRDVDKALECVWVWATPEVVSVGRHLAATL